MKVFELNSSHIWANSRPSGWCWVQISNLQGTYYLVTIVILLVTRGHYSWPCRFDMPVGEATEWTAPIKLAPTHLAQASLFMSIFSIVAQRNKDRAGWGATPPPLPFPSPPKKTHLPPLFGNFLLFFTNLPIPDEETLTKTLHLVKLLLRFQHFTPGEHAPGPPSLGMLSCSC